jgi:hypothetical protein
MPMNITPIPPFPGLQDWERLISFRPAETIQIGVNTRFPRVGFPSLGFPSRACHALEDGHGPINLDYYPVRIAAMPTSGNITMQAGQLLEHLRRNLNLFLNNTPDGCTFFPYDPVIDTAAWLPPFLETAFPGAVLTIDIFINRVNFEDGSVVLSEITSDYWIFSTLYTPNDFNHPVSGNRQFGFVPTGAGEFLFYTRGADRVTTWIDDLNAERVFGGANQLWRSLQIKLAAFVNSNGGLATIEPPISNRYDWGAVQGSYFHPNVNWVA